MIVFGCAERVEELLSIQPDRIAEGFKVLPRDFDLQAIFGLFDDLCC